MYTLRLKILLTRSINMQTAGTDFWTIATAIGTWLAAIATFTAAIVALVAMSSWKKQEKAKAFKNVMMGLRAFLFELEAMPDKLNAIHGPRTIMLKDEEHKSAIKLYTPCCESWGGYRVFSSNKDLVKAWDNVNFNITSYLYRGNNKDIKKTTNLVNELEKQYELANESRIKKWYEKAVAARVCE